jgi:hypothetical protein
VGNLWEILTLEEEERPRTVFGTYQQLLAESYSMSALEGSNMGFDCGAGVRWTMVSRPPRGLTRQKYWSQQPQREEEEVVTHIEREKEI